MRSALTLLGLIDCFCSSLVLASSSYSPFSVTSITASEPNGDPDGQVNFYHINFTVSSDNEVSGAKSTICTQTWGDNTWVHPQAYSIYVPTNQWIECADSSYSFQLYPYFSIGNFTLGVQQNMTDSSSPSNRTLVSGSTHITNTTATSPSLSCKINAYANPPNQHASGSCTLDAPSKISVPITSSSAIPACPSSPTVNTTFSVTAQTSPQDAILLSGSVPELGNWDVSKAVTLSSTQNDGSVANPLWSTTIEVKGGESIEFKYLMKDAEGNVSWECCENRDYDVPVQGYCKKVVAGGDTAMFRGT